MSELIAQFLSKNKSWVVQKTNTDSNYFTKLCKKQKPSVFWIGCCDARVASTKIVGHSLGEVFTHTNIANQVNINDNNLISGLTYAVNVLKVAHIIVCGHTDCAGVQAAIDDNALGALKQWLTPLQKLFAGHNLNNHALSELNIKTQVQTLLDHQLLKNCNTPPQIHGWLFEIETGLIKEVC